MGCHFLLHGIFPTQGLNPGLWHCKQTLYHLSHLKKLSSIWEFCLLIASTHPFFPSQVPSLGMLLRGDRGHTSSRESSQPPGEGVNEFPTSRLLLHLISKCGHEVVFWKHFKEFLCEKGHQSEEGAQLFQEAWATAVSGSRQGQEAGYWALGRS